MKRLLFCIMYVVALFCATDSYPINIANRAGCDTLIMKGSYNQLKRMEAVVMEQLQNKPTMAMKGYMYALLGDIYVALGDYKTGLEWYRKGESAYSKVDFSKEDDDELYYYMQCLYNYASLQFEMGGYLEEIMDKCTKSVGLVARWSPFALQWLSEEKMYEKIMYSSFQIEQFLCWIETLGRKYPQAIEALQKNLAALEKDLYGNGVKCDLEYGQILELIARMCQSSTNYEEALAYLQRSLGYFERACGKNSVHYARVLVQIGEIYHMLNDIVLAEEYFLRSKDILVGKGFVEHTTLAEAYSGMGMIFLAKGNISKADEYLCKACSMQEKLCGEDSFPAVLAKLNSAYPPIFQGNLNKARDIVSQVMKNRTFMGNISSDHFANALVTSVEILLVTQSYKEVIALNEEIEELFVMSENLSRYPIRNYYLNLGRAYKRSGDYKNAVEQFNKVLEQQRAITHDNFSFLTEEQRSNLWELDKTRIGSLFSINMAPQDVVPQVGSMLYDVALLNKGILLQASINLAEVISSSGDEELKKEFTDLRLYMQNPQAVDENMGKLLKEKESNILKRAKQYGDFMQYTGITWSEICNVLGDDDVAIEFVFSKFDGVYTCSAEVICKDMATPKHIILFSIPESEKSSLVAEPGKFSKIAIEKIWSRELLDFIGDRKNVYFVPDGELYNIGIEYIPLANGERMCDKYNMRRLSSTRELVLSKQPSEGHSCYLFGGLNYNTSLSDMELYAYASSSRGVKSFNFTPDNAVGYASWGYLPGTEQEVNSISGTLAASGYTVASFTGNEGVEETFKALSGSKTKIIHIATHGFYLPNKGDALENSGLVFAGANNFWNTPSSGQQGIGFDDGILTAKEISHLNLQGTDLVVMSACQTGLGEVTGEGVFGLQRAFKKAGVQTLLMSLWEVDDQATQLMMSEFYKALAQGAGKREALERAQHCVRQHTFIRNGKEVSGNDPYYWAAFVMMD